VLKNGDLMSYNRFIIGGYPSVNYVSSEHLEKIEKAKKLMVFLEIPIDYSNSVSIDKLYDIIMDEEKLKKLVSKLKLKAFW
jgi:hypothetical protein